MSAMLKKSWRKLQQLVFHLAEEVDVLEALCGGNWGIGDNLGRKKNTFVVGVGNLLFPSQGCQAYQTYAAQSCSGRRIYGFESQEADHFNKLSEKPRSTDQDPSSIVRGATLVESIAALHNSRRPPV